MMFLIGSKMITASRATTNGGCRATTSRCGMIGRREKAINVAAGNAHLQALHYDRHAGCLSDSQCPLSFELATHCVMKFIPSTPS